MKIIVRAAGERTEKECIRRAEQQGDVIVVRGVPFAECLKNTYRAAMDINQKWIPVIDADVLLFPGVIGKAVAELNRADHKGGKIFCLDGKTKDKIFCTKRRAGIHIYRRDLLETALYYIDYNYIKPESKVRQIMQKSHGYKTHVGGIIFGLHDYEQYYRDLWRKAVVQVRKLGGKLKGRYGERLKQKWLGLGVTDADYRVILAANKYGNRIERRGFRMDVGNYYDAENQLEALGIKEKGEM